MQPHAFSVRARVNINLDPAFVQLKHGDIHTTVYAAGVLTANDQPLEVQMSAYTLLQHMVSSASAARLL